MTDAEDYGFFCDLETANTMEYEKVEYYIVTKRTHYEVRRKPANAIPDLITNKMEDRETVCCFNIETPPIVRVDTFNKEYILPKNKKDPCENCFNSVFSFIVKIPRDIYYSFMVCTFTASCVYIIMTLPDVD